jgi:hypothetical protein
LSRKEAGATRTPAEGDAVMTRIVSDGRIVMQPPGLELAVRDLFGAVET